MVEYLVERGADITSDDEQAEDVYMIIVMLQHRQEWIDQAVLLAEVMQGASASVLAPGDDPTLSTAATAKDVWVVGGTVAPPSLSRRRPLPQVDLIASVPTRAAEALYWAGRALERAELLTRSLEVVLERTTAVIDPETVLEMRKLVDQVYVDEQVSDYIVRLVFATREPERHVPQMAGMIRFGASPRATINLALCAKAAAFLDGRGYVTPQDIKVIASDVLRHRVITTFEADADEITSEKIVAHILDEVPVP